MQRGQRVRYSEEFLAQLEDERTKECFADMEGTIVEIIEDHAQVDFGCRFRATSMVRLTILERVND